MKTKNNKVVIASTLLLLTILLVIYLLKNQKIPSTNSNSSQSTTLLLDPKGQNITWTYLTYNFSGTIKDLTPTTQGMLLNLQTDDKKIPTFLLTNSTNLLSYDATKKLYYKTSFASLKSGKTISLVAVYDLSKSSWTSQQAIIQ